MLCYYCGCGNDTHDPICPKPGTFEMKIWDRGYRDGQGGKACGINSFNDESHKRLYQLGWNTGNISLDATNGLTFG